MSTLHTFSDVIALFGHRAELAHAIGEPPGQVRIWRKRGWIPPKFYPDVVLAARDIGHPEVTMELLLSLNQQRKIANGPTSEQSAAE